MIKKALLAAIAGLAATSANAATLISENFENGPGVFTLDGNVSLATGQTYSGCCGTPNDTSNTFVAFGGGNAPSGTLMSTSFQTLLGQLYSVTFDYSALGGGTEPLMFAVAGQNYTVNPVANSSLTFQQGGFTFLGTGAATTFNVFSGGVDNVDAIVDNITVSGPGAVPEPATWAMMLLGFGLVGFGMRRRKAVGSTTRVRYNFA
jgi:hypothetical protein